MSSAVGNSYSETFLLKKEKNIACISRHIKLVVFCVGYFVLFVVNGVRKTKESQ